MKPGNNLVSFDYICDSSKLPKSRKPFTRHFQITCFIYLYSVILVLLFHATTFSLAIKSQKFAATASAPYKINNKKLLFFNKKYYHRSGSTSSSDSSAKYAKRNIRGSLISSSSYSKKRRLNYFFLQSQAKFHHRICSRSTFLSSKSIFSMSASSKCVMKSTKSEGSNEELQITTNQNIPIGCTVRDIAELYDVFLIDQWGVMHDGINAYPGAVECIEELAKLKKSIILLSNSSKRNGSSNKRLEQMGFNPDHFIEVVTSGELTWQALNNRKEDIIKENVQTKEGEIAASRYDIENIKGTNCIVFGNGHDDHDYVTSMHYNFCSVENADFLLARGTFHILDGSEESWNIQYSVKEPLHLSPTCQNILKIAREKGLPMIVSNPDYLRPGDNEPMPGRIGQEYEKLGGNVIYVGKPYSLVYEHCLELLSSHLQDDKEKLQSKLKVCAIGDSYHHDIEGAYRHGYQSAFITDGVHSRDLHIPEVSGQVPSEDKLVSFLQGFNFRPTHIVRRFQW